MPNIDAALYIRKPLIVRASRVTEENMADLAKKCKGQVKGTGQNRHIFVDFPRTHHVRLKMAYVGDFVVSIENSYKFYTEKALKDSFEKLPVAL